MTYTLLCLVGPSGAGKTTIANEMQAMCKIPQICSYTTRPMREGEKHGREHYFIDRKEASEYLMKFRPLAHTIFGGNLYFALFTQICSHAAPLHTYVIDEYGLMELAANVDEQNERMVLEYGLRDADRIDLLPIYIERDPAQIAADIDPDRAARDEYRTELDPSHYRLRIINDSADAASLRVWAKAFAEAITAYLTVTPARDMAPLTATLRTSDASVANIIATINDAYHDNSRS